MENTANILDGARIKPYSSKPIMYQGKEEIIEVYKIITKEKEMFFECPFEWAANGQDFWVTIVNFGTLQFSAAGSTGEWFRYKFTKDEVVSARELLEAYFLGDTGKAYHPLKSPSCHCLGVRYAPDWIVEKT